MPEYIDVNTGQVVVTSKAYILRSMAIGSCIVVSAYDMKAKIAGMAHIMLPGSSRGVEMGKYRYAEDAIMHLLHLMTVSGSVREDIDICLVGAGNVLADEKDTVCSMNICSVSSILDRENLRVKASCLGGFERKAMYLNTINGRVKYSCGDSDKMLLWPQV